MKRIKIKISFRQSVREKFYSISVRMYWMCFSDCSSCRRCLALAPCFLVARTERATRSHTKDDSKTQIVSFQLWNVKRKNHRCIFLESIVTHSHAFFCPDFSLSSVFMELLLNVEAALRKHIFSFCLSTFCRHRTGTLCCIENNKKTKIMQLIVRCMRTLRGTRATNYGHRYNKITSVYNPSFHTPVAIHQFLEKIPFEFIGRWWWNENCRALYSQNAVRPEIDVSCGIRNALKFVGMNGMCWFAIW